MEALLSLTQSPFELMLRGTVMYVFLFFVFRYIVRRDPGSVGITDFLFVVLVGDAAQNAMIGEGTSIGDGMVLILTLVGWNALLDWLSFHVPWISRFLVPRRVTLVIDGKVQRRAMRREWITDDELMTKVRENGLERLDQVKRAYLESDGELSVIERGR